MSRAAFCKEIPTEREVKTDHSKGPWCAITAEARPFPLLVDFVTALSPRGLGARPLLGRASGREYVAGIPCRQVSMCRDSALNPSPGIGPLP